MNRVKIPINRHPFPGEGGLEQPRAAGGSVGRLLLIHAALTYTNKRGNRRDDSRGEHSCLLKTDRRGKPHVCGAKKNSNTDPQLR